MLLLLFSKDMIWWAEVIVKFLGLKVAGGSRNMGRLTWASAGLQIILCTSGSCSRADRGDAPAVPEVSRGHLGLEKIIQQHRAGFDRPMYQHILPTTQSAERCIISRNQIIVSGSCFTPEQSSIVCFYELSLSCLFSQPPACSASALCGAMLCRSLTWKSHPEADVSFYSEDLGRKRQFMTGFVELGIYPKKDVGILALVLCGVNGQEWSVRALNSPLLIGEGFPSQNYSWHCGSLRVCSHSG